MPTVINRATYLEINSVPLATPAWRITDLSKLYGLAVRGEDRLIPATSGSRAYRRWIASRVVGLPLLVEGARTHEDVVNANVWSGLDANVDYLMTNVVLPPATATYSAIWHRASGNLTAEVHVEGFEPEAWGHGWTRFRLELSIPAGRFT